MAVLKTSKPWVLKTTRENDDFFSLFAAYRAALPPGATPLDMAQTAASENGQTRFSAKDIDAWVFSVSGKRRPFVSSDNPGKFGGPPGVGWAVFRAGNQIRLPDIPRAGDTPATPPGPPVATPPLRIPDQNAFGYVALAAAGLFMLVAVLGGKKDKKD